MCFIDGSLSHQDIIPFVRKSKDKIALIYITGNVEQKMTRNIERMNIDGILYKPFTLDDIIGIEKILKKQLTKDIILKFNIEYHNKIIIFDNILINLSD